ncbi:stimulus-sensing domain-containing protein [Magnetospirillum sp. UT-4]|uniref:stimulus-sensing domain-containing protein n=1 Tax=Magnetospirillum sp. UT-4 TaxID=2681467 RepID=UPI001384A2A9|nr:stimulus-sensing domain-containing protein [Magnetospirillum sp. UT-4]CAA7617578.1 Sensor protein ChvG [Magnetospirillum sp. UT-4]
MPRRRRKWRPLGSPLTRRILAVNLIAPVLLVAGLLYLDRYKQGLIRAELAGLATQAEMVAGAVGEGAVSEQAMGFLELNNELAQQMVRRLAKPANLRARLFDAVGELAADSRYLLSPKGNIQIEELEQLAGRGWRARLSGVWDRLTTWMPEDESLPLYSESLQQRADHYPEVMAALAGRVETGVRARNGGGIVLSVAVPVQRYKQVVGALMVSHDGRNVARSLFQVRLAILQVFAVALAITIGLSLYMAGTIARPIRRLAVAAEQVRHGHGRRHRIPDFSDRHDEIGELSLALKEMTEALWTRMDAIERFAADVAHEIKNPLTSVRSAVETAARVSDPAQQRKLLAIVQDDVERLNRLITDISDASRVDAEMSRAETEPVPVRAMVETLGEIYRATAEEDGPRFVVEVPANGDPLVVQGIEGRLVQVLRNLIGNAVSFSPEGGTIRLVAEREGKYVRVSVEDDGPGIPEGKLEAVFERFYSERPEAEKFGTHSGLGLSISRQIVTALGGLIWAENMPKGGTRLVVKLPAG